jgi:hypothetical protein
MISDQTNGDWSHRSDEVRYLDQLPSFDVRLLARKRVLTAGTSFTCSREPIRSPKDRVHVHIEEEHLVLGYCGQLTCVGLERAKCYFGGQRTWFRCPVCGRRACKLYVQNSRFICRTCCGLPYQSQSKTAVARALDRLRNVRQRLAASTDPVDMLLPIPVRPRGMHASTFRHLRAQLDKAEEIVFRDLLDRCGISRQDQLKR